MKTMKNEFIQKLNVSVLLKANYRIESNVFSYSILIERNRLKETFVMKNSISAHHHYEG